MLTPLSLQFLPILEGKGREELYLKWLYSFPFPSPPNPSIQTWNNHQFPSVPLQTPQSKECATLLLKLTKRLCTLQRVRSPIIPTQNRWNSYLHGQRKLRKGLNLIAPMSIKQSSQCPCVLCMIYCNFKSHNASLFPNLQLKLTKLSHYFLSCKCYRETDTTKSMSNTCYISL